MAYHDAPEAVPDSTSPEVVPPQKVLINSPVVPQEPHLSHEADSNAPYASSSEAIYEKRGQSNRICYLPTTAFYIIITFLLLLIGGGIGGGIASAVTKNNGPSNSQSATPTTVTTTTTFTAATATATLLTNLANCPVSNLTTYTSSVSSTKFTIRCDTDILSPSGSTVNPNLNDGGNLETSFNACLDLCASFNANTTKVAAAGSSCVGATWVMNSSEADRILMCYLKRTGGVASADSGQELVSGFLSS